MLIIILLILAFCIISSAFTWLATTAYYEQRIQQNEYFTKKEKRELKEPKHGNFILHCRYCGKAIKQCKCDSWWEKRELERYKIPTEKFFQEEEYEVF